MKNFAKSLISLLFVILIIASLLVPVGADSQPLSVTVLFTHDLHSHFLPVNEDGKMLGGVARLKTAIDKEKKVHPNALLLDAGDFSMGTLFQTQYADSALELRMLGALGYDATTFGNHEYDYLPQNFAKMLNSAVASGDKLPAIVEANYFPPTKAQEGYTDDSQLVWDALDNYPVEEYVLLERGGVHFAIFGINGVESHSYAPNSGHRLYDPVENAQKIVDTVVAECSEKYGVKPFIVCLSHSGTEGTQGEDYELAKAVEGIDLIVSGHSHTVLNEPMIVNDTYIVSSGEYGKYLGEITLTYSDNKSELVEYKLIEINESFSEDKQIKAKVEQYKQIVNDGYLSDYNMSFDQVLVNNTYDFDTVDEVYATQHESTLCNVFSDAYKWSVEQHTGQKVDVALTAAGVIRETLPKGEITVSDVFDAASLGVGTEGELIAVYISGKELKTALEVDASVQPIMDSAQLFFSGVEYSYNTNRMIFNKVDYAMLRNDDGTLSEIEDDKLYRIVTGMYCGQMLGTVESKSFGLLSIVPKDKDGNPIAPEDLDDYVVYTTQDKPLKEWYAISTYLQSMDGTMNAKYSEADNRKVVYSSLSPADILRNANVYTYVVISVVLIIIVVVVLVVLRIVRRKRKK